MKIKSTFELSAEAKHRLATLKADLRMRGIPATEAAIVEALILAAKDETVRKLLR